jgi:hypothetical protein
MARPTNSQRRINKLIQLTSIELERLGFADIPTPVLLSNAVTLALKSSGSGTMLDSILEELETRMDGGGDDIPSTAYLSALVNLLTKGADERDDKDKSLAELQSLEAPPDGKVKRY